MSFEHAYKLTIIEAQGFPQDLIALRPYYTSIEWRSTNAAAGFTCLRKQRECLVTFGL